MDMKRLFDLAIVIPSLILLSPLLGLVAVCVRLDSTGPALFRQRRVGRGGRVFHILKFRTMFQGSNLAGPCFTVSRDPRITRVGRVLRRYKLDELPQLINVLRGDMSLVGPRPQVEMIVAHYPAVVQQIVFSVRPGITDPATIRFRHEEQLLSRVTDPAKYHIQTVLPQKLQMYVDYVRQHTLRHDFAILARTVRCVLNRGMRDAGMVPAGNNQLRREFKQVVEGGQVVFVNQAVR
jgi:lipopolysaccharide/colanic/teichoic acid biosynthesis glycosyltransferase